MKVLSASSTGNYKKKHPMEICYSYVYIYGRNFHKWLVTAISGHWQLHLQTSCARS